MCPLTQILLRLITIYFLSGYVVNAKVFERCELANILKDKHRLSVDEVANWVCIAQYQSNFNSGLRTGAPQNGAHGLFQISDQFWCSPPGKGDACGVSCDRLRDDDLTDDIACAQQIHGEHQRISGDGYNAWPMYQQFCKGRAKKSIDGCFESTPERALDRFEYSLNTPSIVHNKPTSKVYSHCELAKELRYNHNIPIEQIATWVCIAKHESNFNTSAIGSRNSDGSGDHGLFQISDIYWCSPPGKGWACGLSCSQLEDTDITDDVECIKKIYAEHTHISGDGFNAWKTYQPYCKGRSASYIQGCFTDIPAPAEGKLEPVNLRPNKGLSSSISRPGKIYTPCELANELKTKHRIPADQIATWVCIAKHESNFNTSAIGYGDHGLFQISDIFWCSPPGNGWACGLSCSDLENSDITDDVECIKKIYEEHLRLSGDGFNAWTVYKPYCKDRPERYIESCTDDLSEPHRSQPQTISKAGKGKVYKPCELANELRYKYHIPKEQIANWVCIAKHESNFNTSAVGRLNADGSGDHGLFQISDIYWCSPPGNGWACGLSCNELENSDISDDVECMKKIYEEHQRLSGDGFNAWAVYKPYCQGRADDYVKDCFAHAEDDRPTVRPTVPDRGSHRSPPKISRKKGKIYTPCELAKELRYKHHIPADQIDTWVCIAEHESKFNTSAIGRLNPDGSGDHGLFQISDIYWCSPPGKGWACGLSCADLEDSDITDDVECIKKIYEEHRRLSGDGFNAWAVYNPYCKGQVRSYIDGCLDDKVVDHNALIPAVDTRNVFRGPSKVYTRCELANELQFKHKFPEEQIATWVCIAEHESNLNTGAMNSGSGDHGLFQISQIYWCDVTGPGKECRTECSKFRDNDLTDDVACVKKIYKEHSRLSGDGFNAWVVYAHHCKGRSQEYIKGCQQTSPQPVAPTTKRPPIIVPAITAPPDLEAHRDKFAKVSSHTKSSLSKYHQTNVAVTASPPTFHNTFFTTGLPAARVIPAIRFEPTISPIRSGITAGSRFNLPSPTPSFSNSLSTKQSFTSRKSGVFDYFTKQIAVTSKPRFSTTKSPTTSYSDRFAAFSDFDATSRFSTTKSYSKQTFTTTQRPIIFGDFLRGSTPRYDNFAQTPDIYRAPTPTPTPRPQILIPSQVPKTFDIFDFYFDLFKIQRKPIDIPVPKYQVQSDFFLERTTRPPFLLTDVGFSTTRQPFVARNSAGSTVPPSVFSNTPEFRGFRFGTAFGSESYSQLGQSVITTRKPFRFEDIQTTRRPFTSSYFSKTSVPNYNVTKNIKNSINYKALTNPSRVDSATQFRGFKFGSAYSADRETSTRRPSLNTNDPFTRTFDGFQRESQSFSTSRSQYNFETTRKPFGFYETTTTVPAFKNNFETFRSFTERPKQQKNYGFPTNTEDSASNTASTRKSFRYQSRFYPDNEQPGQFETTTFKPASSFDDLFDQFVH